MSLCWPHSSQSTVAPGGTQALLVPAFTNQVSDCLASELREILRVLKFKFRAVFLVGLIQAVGEQAWRDVQDRCIEFVGQLGPPRCRCELHRATLSVAIVEGLLRCRRRS